MVESHTRACVLCKLKLGGFLLGWKIAKLGLVTQEKENCHFFYRGCNFLSYARTFSNAPRS